MFLHKSGCGALCLAAALFVSAAGDTPEQATISPQTVLRNFYKTLSEGDYPFAVNQANGGRTRHTQVERFLATYGMDSELGELQMCTHQLKTFALALNLYQADYEGRYPLDSSQLIPNYLSKVYICPGGSPYQLTTSADAYTLVCRGSHHRPAGQPSNSPVYSSREGLIMAPLISGFQRELNGYRYQVADLNIKEDEMRARVEALEGPDLRLVSWTLQRLGHGWTMVVPDEFKDAGPQFARHLLSGAPSPLPGRAFAPTLVAIANYLDDSRKGPSLANLAVCMAKQKHVQEQLYGIFQRDRRFPADLSDLTMPECPAAHALTYLYQVAPDGSGYTLFCSGHHHAGAGLPANFPCRHNRQQVYP